MKVLHKKRFDQLKLSLLWQFSAASPVKQQLFLYSISITVYAWFMYWIAYDIFVWHKPLIQGNITNYVGAAASIAFIWAEAKLLRNKHAKKTQPEPQQTQQQTEQPKTRKTRTKQHKPPQQTHTNKNTCTHHTQHQQNPNTIPDECLTCTKLLQCQTNKQ